MQPTHAHVCKRARKTYSQISMNTTLFRIRCTFYAEHTHEPWLAAPYMRMQGHCVHREDAAAWIISIFVRIIANK